MAKERIHASENGSKLLLAMFGGEAFPHGVPTYLIPLKDLEDIIVENRAGLTPVQRAVLIDRFWNDLSFQMIGFAVEKSRAWAQSHQRMGLDKLRRYLCEINPSIQQLDRDLRRKKKRQQKKAAEFEELVQKEQREREEAEMECPSYVFLKRAADGSLQLELPIEYSSRFRPISTATYERWLKEKSEDPVALKELEESEMESREATA